MMIKSTSMMVFAPVRASGTSLRREPNRLKLTACALHHARCQRVCQSLISSWDAIVPR